MMFWLWSVVAVLVFILGVLMLAFWLHVPMEVRYPFNGEKPGRYWRIK